jgi:hypothetical protein
MQEKHQAYDNVAWEKGFLCWKKRKTWEHQKDRSIFLNKPDQAIGDNSVTTTKYSFATFVPLALYEQFSKPANVYFLVAETSTDHRPAHDDSVDLLDQRAAHYLRALEFHPHREHSERPP